MMRSVNEDLSLGESRRNESGLFVPTMPPPVQPAPCKHSHSHCANVDLIEQAVERCKATGLRRTRALNDVLHILIEAGQPMTLADVTESKHLHSGADRATVYRLLMKLEERAILRRLGLHDRAA